jgi:hypothetical protein
MAMENEILDAPNRDLQEAILDVIYGASDGISLAEVVAALRQSGFQQEEQSITSLIRSTVANNSTAITTVRSSKGQPIHQWVGSHFGARRSEANRLA